MIKILKALLVGAIMPALMSFIFFATGALAMLDMAPLVFWYERMGNLNTYQITVYIIGALVIALGTFFIKD